MLYSAAACRKVASSVRKANFMLAEEDTSHGSGKM